MYIICTYDIANEETGTVKIKNLMAQTKYSQMALVSQNPYQHHIHILMNIRPTCQDYAYLWKIGSYRSHRIASETRYSVDNTKRREHQKMVWFEYEHCYSNYCIMIPITITITVSLSRKSISSSSSLKPHMLQLLHQGQ